MMDLEISYNLLLALSLSFLQPPLYLLTFELVAGGIVNNTLRPQIPTWCDPEWKSLMESCWAPEPAERPSFSEISQKLRSMAAAMNVK